MTTLKGLYKEQLEAYSAAITADEREAAYNRMLDLIELMKKENDLRKSDLDIRQKKSECEKVQAETDRIKAETETEKHKQELDNKRLDIEQQKIEAQQKMALLEGPWRLLGAVNPFGLLGQIRQQNMNYNMFREEMEYQEKGEIPNRTLDKYISRR